MTRQMRHSLGLPATLAVVLITSSAGCRLGSHETPRAEGDTIKFSHKVHVEAEIDCSSCHEDIYEAEDLSVLQIPKEEKCLECHEEEKAAGKCGMCHSKPKTPGTYAPRVHLVNINHMKHIEMEAIDEECGVCHKTLPEPDRAQRTKPPMVSCLSCHNHQKEYDSGTCEGCHVDLTRMPLVPISLFSHEGDFVQSHRLAAKSNPESCATCHDQTFCADCHGKTTPAPLSLLFPERTERMFIHRADFMSRHKIEAELDSATCKRCHGKTFCDSCHQLQNLSPVALDPRSPHPPGWLEPGSTSFHGTEARHDIGRCATCHDQGPSSNCIDCHKVGGIGGTPHPIGWIDRHPQSEISSNAMCRYCHI